MITKNIYFTFTNTHYFNTCKSKNIIMILRSLCFFEK